MVRRRMPPSYVLDGQIIPARQGSTRTSRPTFPRMRVSIVVDLANLSRRAKVTDSPTGRSCRSGSGRRITCHGSSPRAGETRCAEGCRAAAARGQDSGTRRRGLACQPLIPRVGNRRAQFARLACLPQFTCLVRARAAAVDRRACRARADDGGTAHASTNHGGPVVDARADHGFPCRRYLDHSPAVAEHHGKQPSGPGECHFDREPGQGLLVRVCPAARRARARAQAADSPKEG